MCIRKRSLRAREREEERAVPSVFIVSNSFIILKFKSSFQKFFSRVFIIIIVAIVVVVLLLLLFVICYDCVIVVFVSKTGSDFSFISSCSFVLDSLKLSVCSFYLFLFVVFFFSLPFFVFIYTWLLVCMCKCMIFTINPVSSSCVFVFVFKIL